MKKCKIPNCNYPVFSTGLCKNHQYMKPKKAVKTKVIGKKKKLPTIAKLKKKAEEVFNLYIRQRDSDSGWFTCISCSRTLPVASMNAGHYVPVHGGSYLRYHEFNVNGECEGCNCFDEFHLIGYRKNLINKIGLTSVEWLEENRRNEKRWTRSELLEIIETYSIKKEAA